MVVVLLGRLPAVGAVTRSKLSSILVYGVIEQQVMVSKAGMLLCYGSACSPANRHQRTETGCRAGQQCGTMHGDTD